MNRYLLDTHTLLWYLELNPALSGKAKGIIESPDSDLFVSVVSFWEIAIKLSKGKLNVARSIEEMERQLLQQEMEILLVSLQHVLPVQTLPFHHRDPFDRLLIAQAMTENLTLLSRDPKFAPYPINILW